MLRRLATTLACATFLIVGAGCGKDDESPASDAPSEIASSGPLTKAEYEEAYLAIGESEGDVKGDTLSSIQAAGDDYEQVGDAFQGFAESTRSIGEQYAALDPPEDIADEHRAYADQLIRLADIYGEFAGQVSDADGSEATALLTDLQDSLSQEGPEVALAFAKAAKQGGYNLGFDPAAQSLLP